MFRKRQNINFMPSSSCSLPSTSYDDDGNQSSFFITGHEPLPEIENFKLKNLLKAGVPLEKVGTVVIDSNSVSISSMPSKSAKMSSENHSEIPSETQTSSN